MLGKERVDGFDTQAEIEIKTDNDFICACLYLTFTSM